VPDDAPAVLAYLRRAGGESPHLTFGAEGLGVTEAQERAYIDAALASDNDLFLVAEADGDIVGALTFGGGPRPRTRHVGEFGVSVERAHWGAGVGRALVEGLLAWAAAGGVVRKVNLRVRVDNDRAIALYERLGFAVEGRLTRELCVDGAFHDCLLMGRPIDP
jgi:RimJ/RimL family protein N-acetyltransferase